jgi:hypothetical protein
MHLMPGEVEERRQKLNTVIIAKNMSSSSSSYLQTPR